MKNSVQSLVIKLSSSEHFFTPGSGCWRGQPLLLIRDHIAGLARRMYSFGVAAGSVVAICADQSAEGLWIEQAVWLLGGAVLWIADETEDDALVLQLNRVDASLLVLSDHSRYRDLEEGLDELESLMMVFSLFDNDELVPLMPAAVDWAWVEELPLVSTTELALFYFEETELRLLRHGAVQHLINTALSVDSSQRVMICAPLSLLEARLSLLSVLLQGRTVYWSSVAQINNSLMRMARPQYCVLSSLTALPLPVWSGRSRKWFSANLGASLTGILWLGPPREKERLLSLEGLGVVIR